MIFQKGQKEGFLSNDSSQMSLTNHPKRFNRRRTENTIYAQDYLKTWMKVKKITPVLESTKLNTAIASGVLSQTAAGKPSKFQSFGQSSTRISDNLTQPSDRVSMKTSTTGRNSRFSYSALNLTNE